MVEPPIALINLGAQFHGVFHWCETIFDDATVDERPRETIDKIVPCGCIDSHVVLEVW